jgi:molybdopterin converting factor small subunit
LPATLGVPFGLAVAGKEQSTHGMHRTGWAPEDRRTGAVPVRTLRAMATLRLFASVRVAAGTARTDVAGATVGAVVDAACARFGPEFAGLVQVCRVWRNGEPAERDDPVGDGDEIAILPPVSGG